MQDNTLCDVGNREVRVSLSPGLVRPPYYGTVAATDGVVLLQGRAPVNEDGIRAQLNIVCRGC